MIFSVVIMAVTNPHVLDIGKSLTCAIYFRFLLLSMTIVPRIILPITVTKRRVVKAVPWIKTVSGNLGIRSASLCQVGTGGITQIHPVQKLLQGGFLIFVGFTSKSVIFSVQLEQIMFFNHTSFGMKLNL